MHGSGLFTPVPVPFALAPEAWDGGLVYTEDSHHHHWHDLLFLVLVFFFGVLPCGVGLFVASEADRQRREFWIVLAAFVLGLGLMGLFAYRLTRGRRPARLLRLSPRDGRASLAEVRRHGGRSVEVALRECRVRIHAVSLTFGRGPASPGWHAVCAHCGGEMLALACVRGEAGARRYVQESPALLRELFVGGGESFAGQAYLRAWPRGTPVVRAG